MLADEKGLPLSIVISGANTHDVKLLAATLDDEIIDHPTEDSTQPNKTCALMPVVSAKRLSARLKKGVVSHTHQAKRNFFELNPPGLGRVLN